MYHLYNEQWIDAPIEKAWEFFSDPKNLLRITPKKMNMQIVEAPDRPMHPGMILRYKVSPLFGISMQWTSAISVVKEGEYFLDEMLEGPFKVWHHMHRFEKKEGGTLIIDDLHYKIPLEPLSKIFHSALVGRELKHMFEHRENVIKDLL